MFSKQFRMNRIALRFASENVKRMKDMRSQIGKKPSKPSMLKQQPLVSGAF